MTPSPQYEMRREDVGLAEDFSSDEVENLFEQLHRISLEGNAQERTKLRDHLVTVHAALVEHCARNFAASNEPIEDLVQEGYVGLIKAVDRFDPSQRVRFSTYACHLINGEIRHYLRDLGRLIHEPGWHFELRSRILKAQEELTQKLGRTPRSEEVASAINESASTVAEVLKNQQTLSVEFPDQGYTDDDEDGTAWEFKGPAGGESGHRLIEEQMVIGEVFPHLRDVEKKALMMHFFEDCSKTEVARHLGISINHAAYILKRGLDKLRQMIEASEKTRVPPTPEAVSKAQFVLRTVQRAVGAPLSIDGNTLPSAALIPEMLTFESLLQKVDKRLGESVGTDAEKAEPFSLLWLRVDGWKAAVENLPPQERREANAALQMMTRKCCRATDFASMLSLPNWSGIHFVFYLPATGSGGTRVGRRWQNRFKELGIVQHMSRPQTPIHTQYSFAMFPRDGQSLEALFTKLGQSLK